MLALVGTAASVPAPSSFTAMLPYIAVLGLSVVAGSNRRRATFESHFRPSPCVRKPALFSSPINIAASRGVWVPSWVRHGSRGAHWLVSSGALLKAVQDRVAAAACRGLEAL